MPWLGSPCRFRGAGTAMPLDGAWLKPLHRHLGELLAGLDIANLKSQQFVDVHIAAGIASVDCKGTNPVREWTDLFDDFVGGRVRNEQIVIVQARQIDAAA